MPILSKYEEKYNEPFGMAAALGYDAVHLMGDLLEDKPLTRLQVKKVLDRGFSYGGLFGSVELLEGGHHMSFPVFPVKVVNGTLVYLT